MMKKVYLIVATFLLVAGSTSAQNLNSSNGTYEDRRIINKKKFRVLYNEVVINKTVDEVWEEVAGNFMNIGEIAKNVNFTRCLSGDLTTGLGADRLCNINIQGKTI